MEVFMTQHGINREKERCGFSHKKAMRQAKLAIERGKRSNDFHTTMERDYLQRKEGEGIYSVAYNQFCYIISEENVIITVFPLPKWFGKKKIFDGKTRIRNCKKYSKCYCW